MDTVEIADRHDRAPRIARQVPVAPVDPHVALCPPAVAAVKAHGVGRSGRHAP
jgi:hypothetical protein